MSDKITVYGRATSSNVQAVMWGAAELNLSVERLDFGHKFGGTDTPEFRRMNPFGRVPVLKDGDEPAIFESCAILRYLAAKYGDGGPFWPADAADRAQVDKWAEWGKLNLALSFTVPIFWSVVRTSAADRDTVALERAIDHFNNQISYLDAQLEGREFVAGDKLTLADIVIGHVLYRYFTIAIERRDWPNLAAYYKRLCRRDAYKSHVMISYEDLRVPGA